MRWICRVAGSNEFVEKVLYASVALPAGCRHFGAEFGFGGWVVDGGADAMGLPVISYCTARVPLNLP